MAQIYFAEYWKKRGYYLGDDPYYYFGEEPVKARDKFYDEGGIFSHGTCRLTDF